VLYLVKSRAEARAATGVRRGYLARLPEAAGIDRVAYRVHASRSRLDVAVLCGAIWAQYAWGRYWAGTPRRSWAFITWVVYAAYLHARAYALARPRGGLDRTGRVHDVLFNSSDQLVRVRAPLLLRAVSGLYSGCSGLAHRVWPPRRATGQLPVVQVAAHVTRRIRPRSGQLLAMLPLPV
jgi:hypothetical protein